MKKKQYCKKFFENLDIAKFGSNRFREAYLSGTTFHKSQTPVFRANDLRQTREALDAVRWPYYQARLALDRIPPVSKDDYVREPEFKEAVSQASAAKREAMSHKYNYVDANLAEELPKAKNSILRNEA